MRITKKFILFLFLLMQIPSGSYASENQNPEILHQTNAVFKISNSTTTCRFLLHYDQDSYFFEPGETKTLSFSATSKSKRVKFRFLLDVECDGHKSEPATEIFFYKTDNPLLNDKITSGYLEAFLILKNPGTASAEFQAKPALIFSSEYHVIEKLEIESFPSNAIKMTLDDESVWWIFWPMSASVHFSLDEPVEKNPHNHMFRLKSKRTNLLFVPIDNDVYRAKFWGDEAHGY